MALADRTILFITSKEANKITFFIKVFTDMCCIQPAVNQNIYYLILTYLKDT